MGEWHACRSVITASITIGAQTQRAVQVSTTLLDLAQTRFVFLRQSAGTGINGTRIHMEKKEIALKEARRKDSLT